VRRKRILLPERFGRIFSLVTEKKSAPGRTSGKLSNKVLAVLIIACAAVAIPAAIVMFAMADRAGSKWFGAYDANAREAYDFELTDQTGSPFQLGNLRGNIILIGFGFTNCPSICPSMLAALANVARRLPPEAQENLRVVFVSIDPERDTPEKLKAFVPLFDKRFIGLTGDPSAVAAVSKAYGAFFKKNSPKGDNESDYLVDHTTSVALIDPEGKLRMSFRFDQLPESDRIAGDILRILAAEKPGSPPR